MRQRVTLPAAAFPDARVFRVPGGVRPPLPPPLRARRSGLGGGDHRAPPFPLPTGGVDNLDVWPYEETPPVWGVSGPPGSAIGPPPIGGAPAPASQAWPGFLPNTTPNGQTDPNSALRWSNPTTFAVVPITAATPNQVPVLSLNFQRNALIIQNNSTATAPDTTPTFYIGFNAAVASAGFGLALVAGQGIVFDYICPRDSIFILQAGGAGATLIVAGVCVQGTYAPAASPPQQ